MFGYISSHRCLLQTNLEGSVQVVGNRLRHDIKSNRLTRCTHADRDGGMWAEIRFTLALCMVSNISGHQNIRVLRLHNITSTATDKRCPSKEPLKLLRSRGKEIFALLSSSGNDRENTVLDKPTGRVHVSGTREDHSISQ